MGIVDKIISPAASFQRQVFLTMAVGLVLLALTASVTTSWLASLTARQHLMLQARQVTENFARQSVLALLFGSADNASDSAAATLNFPDVAYVSIIDLKGHKLLAQGAKGVAWVPPLKPEKKGAVLGRETATALDFYAPVYTHQDSQGEMGSPFQAKRPRPELIGTVHVEFSKVSLLKEQGSIFFNNISLSLSFALVLLVFLRLLVKRMTTPLQNLSTVMALADQQEDAQLRAEIRGPAEITQMAQTFNKMMETLEERDMRLRRHRDMLETEVALRTQELVQARDEALQASRHKSEFLANMSHELRTPMNAIIGYTEMVIEDLEGQGQVEAVTDLKRVQNASRHLLGLINSVLDLSKIEAGRMDLWIEPVSIDEMIRQVRDSVDPMITKNRNRFELATDVTDDTVEIDSAKLRQVLVNLLSNAAKFTSDGLIRMSIRRDDHVLMVDVNDTGIGIPEDQLEHIFEAFHQGEMGTTRNYGGTGLGLGISRSYCQLMGGDIAVCSTEGEGSTFTVHIPLPVNKGDVTTQQLYEQPAKRGPRQSERSEPLAIVSPVSDLPTVMIVDDDRQFSEEQGRALDQAGYRVLTADESEDLMDEIRVQRPDMLILEVFLKLPNDGWTLLAQLKADEDLRDIPVVVVSVLDEQIRAMEMGAETFLVKPVRPAELLTALENLRQTEISSTT